MMDGKNCAGRKISLLNDGSDVAAVPAKAAHAHAGAGAHYQHREHHHHSHHHHHHHHHHRPYPYAHHAQQLLHHLPPLAAHARSRSRASSRTSTPSLSPQTPQLVRSDSSDSRVLATPSPLTPSFTSFDQAVHARSNKQQPQQPQQQQQQQLPPPPPQQSQSQSQHYYFAGHRHPNMDDPAASLYPPIPDATGQVPSAYQLPPHHLQIPQQLPPQQSQPPLYRSSNSPASEPSHVSTISAASNSNNANANAAAANAKAVPKKNQYPCPMAKQLGCTDFFTTSGHAARHAKKHTGKKDAFCPECNKAFTRKDNMEQHRRTHQNGRGASRASDDKVKKPTKPSSKKSAVKAEQQPALEAVVEQQLADQQQQQQQQLEVNAQMHAAAQAQIAAAQQQQLQADAVLIPSQAGPYFLSTLDPGPVPALPMPAMTDLNVRPSLSRSSIANSLDFIPAITPLDPETLNYSYPSPGLSNGLNSLALAASEHRRISEEKARSPPSDTMSHDESP